nr:NADH dehydrogenase subunit 4 [Cylindrotaenia sp. MN-2022]
MSVYIVSSVGSFLVAIVVSLLALVYGGGGCLAVNGFSLLSRLFVFDSVSYYLLILVVFLGLYSQILFFNVLSTECRLFLTVSLVFSGLCFCTNHSILFWCCYELSMLPLLLLIFKDSPYSERFAAGWYFLSYLSVTSLPLILVLLYLSVLNGSFFFSCWSGAGNVPILIALLLAFIFFTKVPLVPFHTWLPIVHAEATSIVSMFLSGYIMKLGLLGVYRCTYYLFDSSLIYYLFFCCFLCIVFLVSACGELDGKRWLAFLSLAHIVVPFFGVFVSDWATINVSFFYCLGHGLSAGLIFCLLWHFYDLSNSRNWVLVKHCVSSRSYVFLSALCLLSLCSFPVTIQFFCEVYLVMSSSGLLIYLFFWFFYLFMGGLVPLVLCGHLLVRNEYFEFGDCMNSSYCYFITYGCLWCYLGIFIV